MNPSHRDKPSTAPVKTQSLPRRTPAIADHTLLRKIGEGSYGEVWLAKNVMGTFRAVKIVYRDSFKDGRPYEREFAGIKKFEPLSRSHEGLIDVLHIGRNEQAGYFYYVMELGDAEGDDAAITHPKSEADARVFIAADTDSYKPRTLWSDLQCRGRLPFDECVAIGLSLGSALSHLHRNGLIHRDIKPSNIIFVRGVAKLADIGLVTDASEAQTFVGTEGFIPPEGPGTAQADIYSLGKVLYEMATGKDRNQFPELPTDLGETNGTRELIELNEIILKACEADVRCRYTSAENLLSDLQLLKQGKSVRRRRSGRRLAKYFLGYPGALIFTALLGLGMFHAVARHRLESLKQQMISQGEDFSLREVNPALLEPGKRRPGFLRTWFHNFHRSNIGR
jgi:serine/threonine protein kinase